MKLFKLGQKGITHILIPMIVIVGLAVGGAAYAIATHADSVTPSSDASWCVNRSFNVSTANPYSICIKYSQYMMNSFDTYFTQFAKDTPLAQHLAVNGYYGVNSTAPTFLEVTRWQKIANVTATPGEGVDGELGPFTWQKLCQFDTRMWNDVKGNANIPSYIKTSVTYANAAHCSQITI